MFSIVRMISIATSLDRGTQIKPSERILSVTHNDRLTYVSLKTFLFLVATAFAFSVALSAIFFTSAATATGSTWESAITLTNHINTGILGPTEQRWFRVVTDQQHSGLNVPQSLTFIFAPNSLLEHVSLQVFTAEQVQQLEQIGVLPPPSGVGQWFPRESNAKPGGFFWSGSFSGGQTYFIRISNASDFPVDYWLLVESAQDASAGADNAEDLEELAIPSLGTSPGEADSLTPGRHQGRLQPYSTYWYTLSRADPNESIFQDLSFSLFFTPDDGQRQHRVNFQLYTFGEIEAWQRGARPRPANFGAGMLVSRDGDPYTGERIWRGTIIKNDIYFLAVENGTDIEIDYYLYDQDITNPELGSESEMASSAIESLAAAAGIFNDRTVVEELSMKALLIQN